MASQKNLDAKEEIVKEISSKLNNNNTFLILDYQGLNVDEFNNLRNDLKDTKSEIKVYKNTMLDLALKNNKIDLSEYMNGPNVCVFSEDILEPIKVISSFAKENDKLKMRIGYINGQVVGLDVLNKYASIPSYEGLLTMFARGLMEHVRNLSIALNLYAEKMEGGKNGEINK